MFFCHGALDGRRQEDERKRREEELRRLRALKRQELETKLKEIQDISGRRADGSRWKAWRMRM